MMLKQFSISAIGVFFKLMAQLGVSKVLAVYLGPSGLALIGQFQTLIQMMSVLSTSTINGGIVSISAQHGAIEPLKDEVKYVWRASVAYSFLVSFVVIVFSLLFSSELSIFLLGSIKYESIPVVFASLFFFMCMNNVLMGVLNGFGYIVHVALANVIGSLISLILTYLLASTYSTFGALMALAVYQSIWFIATLGLCARNKWLSFANFFGKFNKNSCRFLSRFFFMSLATAIFVPISQYLVRNYFINAYGYEIAGFWEAIQRLSLAYLSLATTVLTIYFVPRYAKSSRYEEIVSEIITGVKVIVCILCLALPAAYWGIEYIVLAVYNDEFLPIKEFMFWQIVGDFFKILSFVFSYYIYAKGKSALFMKIEFIFIALYVILTISSVSAFGISYMNFGYACCYMLYLIYHIYIFFLSSDSVIKETRYE